ncbi:MAG: macro domain-containing protein [Hydrotalea sp.]|nr:macro domain-containing protein [Hydrotalea sp.]
MIILQKGKIEDADAEALVNSVNCVGVMGRGVALAFKEKYSNNFKEYEKACQDGLVQTGKMFVYSTKNIFNPKYIINFPTKVHWRGKSKIEYIEDGLQDLINAVKKYKIQSIAIPPLGCGLGGLNWQEVSILIKNSFQDLPDVKVFLYEPNQSLADNKFKTNYNNQSGKLTTGRASLVLLIDSYLEGLLDEAITLLEVHKLMYFMQAFGEPLRLQFNKEQFGPYAQNLRFVLDALCNHFIKGFEQGDKPNNLIELLPGAKEKSEIFLNATDTSQTKENIEKVKKLIDGFEDSFGMELLSSVHWATNEMKTNDSKKIINYISNWSDRKKKLFQPEAIEIAIKTLEGNGLGAPGV